MTESQLLPPTELALQVPQEVSTIALGSAAILVAAQEYEVNSEPSFQVADEIQAQLKTEAKAINDKRLEFTRPIDAIKKKWMDFFAPAVDARTEAVKVYQAKMSAFLAAEQRKKEGIQREGERVLREQKERQEAEARKLEERAAALKTPARAEALMREADEIRQAAAMMPSSVALTGSVPKAVASNVYTEWVVDEFTDEAAFLHWYADHPEWRTDKSRLFKLETNTRPMLRFADQCHVLEIPGVKFKPKDVFRSKSR